MLKTLTLRMAASTLLAFSVGVALAAGPGNSDSSLSTGAATGGEETVRDVKAPTEGRIRLPRPRKVPSRAPAEIGRAQASADPGEESAGHDASRDAHDRYANTETSYLLDQGSAPSNRMGRGFPASSPVCRPDTRIANLGICDTTPGNAAGRRIIWFADGTATNQEHQ